MGVARQVSDLHMRACLQAGLSVSGTQQLAATGTWSYKLGPCQGVELGDQLWTSRHLLRRVAEQCGASVSFEPCVHWGAAGQPSSGCFLEFSTQASRTPEHGMAAVQQHIMRLQAHHAQHHSAYAAGSPSLMHLLAGSPEAHASLRRSGSFTSAGSHSSAFTCGVGNKRASVMIPSSTLLNKCGPIVDRRPPSNMDPYVSTLLLVAAALDLAVPPSATRSLQHLSSSPPRTGTWTGVPASSFGGSSFCTGTTSGASGGNSEDLLISELDRRDQFAPNTPAGQVVSALDEVSRPRGGRAGLGFWV
jgi:glutamine synthetase